MRMGTLTLTLAAVSVLVVVPSVNSMLMTIPPLATGANAVMAVSAAPDRTAARRPIFLLNEVTLDILCTLTGCPGDRIRKLRRDCDAGKARTTWNADRIRIRPQGQTRSASSTL